MAGKITALRTAKRNKSRVNVFIDDQYAFSLTAIVAAQLHRGQHLSDAEIAELKKADAYQRAYDQALNYLSYRPRSQAELERYLRDKGVEPETVEAVVERLQELQLLDDTAFARSWVESRESLRPKGKRGLWYELRRKGVAPDVIQQVLSGLDEESSAYRAAATRARRYANLDRPTFYRRLGGFLERRGFNYDIIQHVVDRLWQEIHTDPQQGDAGA